MSVLVLDPPAKSEIQKVISFAEGNRIDLYEMKKIRDGLRRPVGDFPEYVCFLSDNYRVVYCIEEQPLGWCRHISVSIGQKKLPSIPAVELIMDEFGFVPNIQGCVNVWLEEDVTTPTGDKVTAVNVLQLYEEGNAEKI